MTSQSPSHGFSLARLRLRSDQDLVTFTRQVRRAGEEFGLAPRDTRSLSAATYAVAWRLTGSADVDAEARLDEGPSLQVVFRVPAAATAEGASIRARLQQGIEEVHGMVHHAELIETERCLSGSLRALFPRDGFGRPPLRVQPPATWDDDLEGLDTAEMRERYAALQAASRELQSELEETNRGVVTLHAELEFQTDQLRGTEDRLRLLLDGVRDYAICMLSARGEVASWNAGAERLFGYTADQIIGRHVSLFYDPAERDRGQAEADLRTAAERGRFAGDCVRVRHGGGRFDAHVVITAVTRPAGHELAGFSLVVRDITERKRLEQDLRRRAEDLEAANRAKEEFLATLSHELRTPLNAMLGWTRLLRLGKLDAAGMSRALETIERNAHIQEQLISDILDVSRIVTGRLRLDLRPMQLGPVVDAAVDAVRPAAEAKDLRVEVSIGFDGSVLGDPDRLQQVVWNLLVNAIKFTPAGGAVRVETAKRGSHVLVKVADTGEGIPDELLPFIFDRFRQGDASVTRPHGGLGLGLSIVRHIVELHGGRVQAQSDGHGRGATFTVFLPVRASRQGPVLVQRQAK